MSEVIKVICPVCKERIGTRYAKFVYHKVMWPHTGKRVPCGGTGRSIDWGQQQQRKEQSK